jgi:hypothetical protein
MLQLGATGINKPTDQPTKTHYTNLKKNTIIKETHNKLNDLDFTITNKHNQLTFGIYRKPTTTNLIINNNSCHPHEYEKSVTNYLINRMNTYPITHEDKDQE